MWLPARINRLVGQAMHDYAMLADGDRVLVAVSGGVDSLVLARLLVFWQRKAPVRYQLVPVHIDMHDPAQIPGEAPGAAVAAIRESLAGTHLELCVVQGERPYSAASEGGGNQERASQSCFACARARRRLLFKEARRRGCNKIALGHHQDDLIETFLLNITCAGNISTMRPRQDLFAGRLALIRPLAYVEKQDIEEIARTNGLRPVPSGCPLAEKTRRQDIHNLATEIYRRIPDAKRNIFAALGNVRTEYLLSSQNRHSVKARCRA